jgi:integrase
MKYRVEVSGEPQQVPEPRAARGELATQDEVDALGLGMTVEEARLVLTVLSGLIARGRSKTRDKVSQMTAALVACCLVEGCRDGVPFEAAHPGLPRFGWPAGATAFRRLGIDHMMLERYWTRARTRSTDACLPAEWVLAFVPAPLWRAVLTVIEWGPGEVGLRLEDAVIEMAQQELKVHTRRRPEGSKISAGTITTRITGLMQLCEVIRELRARAAASQNPGLPVKLLDPWQVKPLRPNVELCGATWAQVETSGPSLEQAQGLLRRLDADVQSARRSARYWKLRRRLIAGLLCAHGQRVEAIHALDVDDYRPAHNFGDGNIGPAIVYRPGKTRSAEQMHILALTEELACWVVEWIAYTGRAIGQKDSPMWPHREPKADLPIRRLNASAFARLVSGHAAKDGTGSLPLLPRGEDRYAGYSAHSYRHCCYQTMRRAGAQAKLAQPHSYGDQTPDDFARAVVGHDLIRGVGDVYRDLDQAHLSRVAIALAWHELRHRPVVLGHDTIAINDACERVEQLDQVLAGYAGELEALEERQAALTREGRSSGERRDLAVLESNALVFTLAALQHQVATVGSLLEAARIELNAALDEEIEIEIGDQAMYLDALSRARQRAGRALVGAEIDGSLSVRDVACILGKTPQTINSWIRTGKATSFWQPDAWGSDDSGRRMLSLPLLNGDALTPLQRQRLALAQLRLRGARKVA